MANTAGRPPKWTSKEEIEARIEDYFEYRAKNNLPFTITGLALALDTTRELLCDYENKDEFSDTIKRAKMRCEDYAETQLFTGKNQAGSIFALKNYGWRDQQNIDHTSGGKPIYLPSEILDKHKLNDSTPSPENSSKG